jgi:SepF-like predicted cell division protein (DUF552 family)
MVAVEAVLGVISATSAAVSLVDKIADSYLKFRGKISSVPEEHRAEIVASGDNKSLLMLSHGVEIQRLTYQQLTARLNEGDLSYIRSLERSINTHKTVWEEAYPQLASESNPVTKAKVRNQLNDVANEMGSDLTKILNFVEKLGVHLDDHYIAVRDIAEGK